MKNCYEEDELYRHLLTGIREADEKMRAILKEGDEVYNEIKSLEAKLKDIRNEKRDMQNYIDDLVEAAQFIRKEDPRCLNDDEAWCIGGSGIYYQFEFQKEQ